MTLLDQIEDRKTDRQIVDRKAPRLLLKAIYFLESFSTSNPLRHRLRSPLSQTVQKMQRRKKGDVHGLAYVWKKRKNKRKKRPRNKPSKKRSKKRIKEKNGKNSLAKMWRSRIAPWKLRYEENSAMNEHLSFLGIRLNRKQCNGPLKVAFLRVQSMIVEQYLLTMNQTFFWYRGNSEKNLSSNPIFHELDPILLFLSKSLGFCHNA